MSQGFEIPEYALFRSSLKHRNRRNPFDCVDRTPDRAIIILLSITRVELNG